MVRKIVILCAGMLLTLAATAAQAQAYPARPIRFVVPYAPGGPLDLIARAIGQKLTEATGQAVVVDNKPGAGGNIGGDIVAKAAPDGYTIVMGRWRRMPSTRRCIRKSPTTRSRISRLWRWWRWCPTCW